MQANPVSILSVLQGTKVYQVPIYQRRYSWRATEWSSLWDDLEFKVAESDTPSGARPHFLGNIVVQSLEASDSTVVKYLVIDGQQRLTTLIIFLAALRDAKIATGSRSNPDEYNNKYLLNPFDLNDQDRLVPTEFDRQDYVSTIRDGQPSGGIGRAYLYFSRKLRGRTEQQLDVIANTLLRKFLVILVETDEIDPVNTIFNTLNSKGRPLLPPDLIRNEIFMHLPPDRADHVYYEQWLPLEDSLVTSTSTGNLQTTNFTTFFWSREVPNNPVLSKKMLFNAFESRLRTKLENKSAAQKTSLVLDEVGDIMSDLELFVALRDPTALAKDASITGPVKAALIELDEWGSDTHVPIALWVLKNLRSGNLGQGPAAAILRTTLSFVVSRALTGVPTNTLSRILSGVPASLRSHEGVSPLSTVTRELSKPGNRWPSALDIRRSVTEYGLSTLSARQQSMLSARVGDFDELDTIVFLDRLEDWLVIRPSDATDSGIDSEKLLAENLFSVLETFTPYEYTTDADLAIVLRASLDSVRSHVEALEGPLRELVRVSGSDSFDSLTDVQNSEADRVLSKLEVVEGARKHIRADDLRSRLAASPDQDADEGLNQ